jgi:hypothetical protein
VSVRNSTIIENTSELSAGSGIDNAVGSLLVVNSTIAHNIHHNVGGNCAGGAVSNSGGTVLITNSTVADNIVEQPVSCGSTGVVKVTAGGTIELKNTLVARNSALAPEQDCSGEITSLGHNLIGNPTSGCFVTLQQTDLTGNSGLDTFTDSEIPGHSHIPLLDTSRAINAGDDTACPPTDQLGQARVGICDMGAIEFQP